jgi:integrase
MSNIKNKKLLELKKLVNSQKEKYGITENFSYRFDYKTKKLILCYTLPKMFRENGDIKVKKTHKEKYFGNINEKNFRKYFKGSITIVKDHDKWVKNQRELAEKKYDVGMDEFDFRWWVESYISRSVGQTKTIKILSPLTIKQNKFHLNEYYDWCLDNYTESYEIDNHIENGADWFEKFYEERLSSGRWSPSTIGISYRNIRGFYNYIADRSKGRFQYDILKRLKVPQAQNKRDTINPFEYEKIIDFIINEMNDIFWGKFILMMRLQLKTGMRVGELVSIRNRNIDINNKRIQIVGKGDRSRVLNFGHEDDKKIWEDLINKKHSGIYLFHRTRIQKFPKENRVIEVDIDLNLPTTSSYYLQRFRQMREHLGLRGKGVISSHSLRRYFITSFLTENPHQRDLCRMIVGHSSTRMTDYYVGNMILPRTKTTISIGV